MNAFALDYLRARGEGQGMERKPVPLGYSFSGIRLKRSDLPRLVEILRSDGGQVEADSDRFTFRDVDELLASKEELSKITLRRINPHLKVTVTFDTVWVEGESNNETIGMTAAVRSLAYSRTRVLAPLVKMLIWPAVCVLAGLVPDFVKARYGVDIRSTRLSLVVMTVLITGGVMAIATNFRRTPGTGPIVFRNEAREAVKWRAVGYEHYRMIATVLVGAVVGGGVMRACTTPAAPPAAAASQPAATDAARP